MAVSGDATEGINGRSYAMDSESSKISMLPAMDVFVPIGRTDVFATDGAIVSLIMVWMVLRWRFEFKCTSRLCWDDVKKLHQEISAFALDV